MCGIFGWVAKPGRRMDLGAIQEIADVTQSRGRHAFGFAWVDSRDRLRMYKHRGAIGDHLGVLALARDARMLIGHCRYATQGTPRDNGNNHPHPSDGGWIVHNGKVLNYAALVERYRLWPNTGCDSEAIGLLLEQARGGLTARIRATVGVIAEAPFAMMGLWSRPGTLAAVRRGHPLSMGEDSDGYYLASLREGLPGKVTAVRDRSGIVFDGSGIRRFRLDQSPGTSQEGSEPSGEAGSNGRPSGPTANVRATSNGSPNISTVARHSSH